jgi:hypothetical protein
MINSQFSETQFVIGFLREFLNRKSRRYWFQNFLKVPSTVTEIQTGADLIIEKVSGSDFFQFKRSDYLKNRRGLPRSQRQLDKSFFECFRFKVYNSSGSRQFDTLRMLAEKPNNYCAYIAPLFYRYSEFDTFFQNVSIMSNSIQIECSQFNTGEFRSLNSSTGIHHLLFNDRDRHCWFCSDPIQAVSKPAILMKERAGEVSIDFASHVDEILSVLIELNYRNLRPSRENTTEQKIKIINDILFKENNIIWIPRF